MEENFCGSGEGKGKDTFTSGYELTWTTNPTQYDNQYFKNLVDLPWREFTGLSGKKHWVVNLTNAEDIPEAPLAHSDGTEDIGMFTTDIALIQDEEYKKIVEEYAANNDKFLNDFAAAWYKLTTRDVGPRTRCTNDDAPPAQDWQVRFIIYSNIF